MAATGRVDLYLLKGGPETDDYAARRLACSDASLNSDPELMSTKSWCFGKPPDPSLFINLDISGARVQPNLLIPKSCYRVEFGTTVKYYNLVHYERVDNDLYLVMDLL